jgi:uncharacterized protein YndB with AHSA1/START domain
MPRRVASVPIKRRVEDVFAVVSDPTNTPKWNSSLVSATKTSDGPTGVGTTVQSTGNMFGRQLETEFTVTEFEVNRRFAVTATKPFPLTMTLTLKPISGGTRVDLTADVEPGGLFKLASPLMVRMGKRQNQSNLENLREMLEAKAL